MLVQELYLPLTFSKKENSINSSVFIDQFLKEAIQILKHADISLSEQTEEPDYDNDQDTDSVTWQLNLTPTMMTLDTSINTISGLEKVLELIRINVKPQPPKFKDKKRPNSTQFDISLFQKMFEPVLRLSTISMARSDQLLQYNTMQMMRHFVTSFINCGYSFFLDVPSLIANTEMILSQPNAAKEHIVETLLITSICSLMVRHTTVHHGGDMNVANSVGLIYYNQARQLLQDLFDVHHISVVQSLFILSLFPQGHHHLISPARTRNNLLTMAIRMALAMDLHKLDIEHNNESDQKEKLRRLAWMILCSDYYSDWNTSGQSGLIEVSDWHVDFPQPLPNEKSHLKIEYFSHYCRIILIRKLELFKSAYMISLQSKKALESGLDHQLFQTYFNTPDKLKLNYENTNWKKTDIESLLLHELYCHTQLFAQLPFLPKRYVEYFIAEEDNIRYNDMNQIYQRITNKPIAFTQLLTKTLVEHQKTKKFTNLTETDKELEFHCLVNFMDIMNKYTLILEALTIVDSTGCYHSPLYGLMLTIHLYLMIEKSCQHAEIKSLCQMNLIRTQRILHQTRTVHADPTYLFLDRMLTRHHIIPNDQLFKTQDVLNSLLAKSTIYKRNM